MSGDAGSRSERPRSLRRRVAFAAIGVALVAVLLELTAFTVLHVMDNSLGDASERHLYNPIRGHELNPAYRRRFDTGGRRIHSSQGFRRDGVVAVPKPADTYRIVVLGGSALYGIGVQDDATYPLHPTLTNEQTVTHFLERALDAAAPAGVDVEVINAGVTAYHTFQHVLYLYETLWEYEPDLVAFLDGHNDFYSLSAANPIRSYGYSSTNLVRALNARAPFVTAHVAARYLGDVSHVFKLVEKATFRLFERYEGRPRNAGLGGEAPVETFEDQLREAARVGFLRNYALAGALARQHGFAMRVFLQPEIVFEDTAALSDSDRAIRATTETLYGAATVSSMTRARDAFPALFDAAGIAFVDVGAIADPASSGLQLYIDYCHLSPAGAEAVARRMLPALVADAFGGGG